MKRYSTWIDENYIHEMLIAYCDKYNIHTYGELFSIFTMDMFDKSMSPAKLKKLKNDEYNVWKYEEEYDKWVLLMAEKDKLLVELDETLYVKFTDKKQYRRVCKVLHKYTNEDYNIFEEEK